MNSRGEACFAHQANAEVNRLLASLRHAQATWAARPLSHRLQVCRRFRENLASQCGELAWTEGRRSSRQTGEVIASEFIPLADACRFLEKNAARILRTRREGLRGRPMWLHGARSEVFRDPYGVVLITAPSNYPWFLPGVQALQALVAGNAVALKPGVGGASAASAIARLLGEAGLPPGLLVVLPEDPATAQTLIDSGVDKVFFTGSFETGRHILSHLAARAIPSVMELSGCDPVLIRQDADLDLAVRALTFGLTLNRGRTCIAPRRVYVARALATEFEGRLAASLAQTPTHLLEGAPAARLGPIIQQALAAGAHLLSGKVNIDGRVTVPIVLAGVPSSSRLLKDDFFAPVMSVVTVASDSEAVELANQNPYALGGSIFSRDTATARSLALQLRAGGVVINDLIAPTADPRLPFSGRAASGFGATRGPEGLLEMTTPRVITTRGGKSRPHYSPACESDNALMSSAMQVMHGRGPGPRLAALWRTIKHAVKRTDKRNVT